MVTIDVLVNTFNHYWLLRKVNGRAECDIVAHSGGIGEDLLYHVDHAFAKKTNFSLKRSPSGKLAVITVEYISTIWDVWEGRS